MGNCSECGQHVIAWNEIREREVEDETVETLLQLLGGDWRKVADNAIQLDWDEGYVTVIIRPFIKEQ